MRWDVRRLLPFPFSSLGPNEDEGESRLNWFPLLFVLFEARFSCNLDAWDKSISSRVSWQWRASPFTVSLSRWTIETDTYELKDPKIEMWQESIKYLLGCNCLLRFTIATRFNKHIELKSLTYKLAYSFPKYCYPLEFSTYIGLIAFLMWYKK